MKRKGIILAGGYGTRLYPSTLVTSKHLLPVFDKPMIYYPLSTLMLADIQEVLIISTPQDISRYELLLGDGSNYGLNLNYATQNSPGGLAQAFLIGKNFINQDPSALILGDNIFYGHGLQDMLKNASQRKVGASIFVYHVYEPQRYGVVKFDLSGKITSIEEKPSNPKSNYVATGLYFYDQDVVSMAKQLKPSLRGELEITDLNLLYLNQMNLHAEIMGRGYAWMDAGTQESLLQAGNFIATLEERQGLKIACIEEIAFHNGWINESQLLLLADKMGENAYKSHILRVLQEYKLNQ